MKRGILTVLLTASAGWAQGPADPSAGNVVVRPGALQAMSTSQLRQVMAGRTGFAGLPPAAALSPVVTCQYAPRQTAGARVEVRHYWYEAPPTWLTSVPAAHPIHRLVRGAATTCPADSAATSTEAAAPSSAAAAAANDTATGGPTPNFTAKGLENEPTLVHLYRGDFRKIELERESTLFGALFSAYLNAYGRRCASFLPANKVEMTRSVCAREQYMVNGYGNRVGGSTCIEYRQEGTGIFADPVLYGARRDLERRSAPDALRDALKMVTRPDALGSALNLAGELKILQADMGALVEMNGCATPALKRFETNLMAYSQAKPGVAAAGLAETPAPARAAAAAAAGPFQDSNYTRLLDDLVAEQSKTWAMNRFEAGSMSGVSVAARDNAGRPAKITGRYTFRGFNGRSQGAVTVEFVDGEPECLYFFDFPTTCRKASRRVSSAYAAGAYR